MPKISMCHRNEDASAIFAQRKKDALDRIADLKAAIEDLDPEVKDQAAIAKMDYILKSLDNVIQDTRSVGA